MKGVDTPVEDTFGVSEADPNLYVAYLEMAVHPGVKTVIDTTNNPWEFGSGTPELEARYHHACKTSLAMCREQADNSTQPAGIFRGVGGADVLSVRLSDVCQHGTDQWVRKACGHTWCERCLGYVDPNSRVALTSPGPIITCNRIPKPRKNYRFFFSGASGRQ